jgi:hypothetical protein
LKAGDRGEWEIIPGMGNSSAKATEKEVAHLRDVNS